jgi:hypothetical protein
MLADNNWSSTAAALFDATLVDRFWDSDFVYFPRLLVDGAASGGSEFTCALVSTAGTRDSASNRSTSLMGTL